MPRWSSRYNMGRSWRRPCGLPTTDVLRNLRDAQRSGSIGTMKHTPIPPDAWKVVTTHRHRKYHIPPDTPGCCGWYDTARVTKTYSHPQYARADNLRQCRSCDWRNWPPQPNPLVLFPEVRHVRKVVTITWTVGVLFFIFVAPAMIGECLGNYP